MVARPLFYLSSARRARWSARYYQTGAGSGVFSRVSSTSVQGSGAQCLMAVSGGYRHEIYGNSSVWLKS